jgi:hypothetical protein
MPAVGEKGQPMRGGNQRKSFRAQGTRREGTGWRKVLRLKRVNAKIFGMERERFGRKIFP